ncbi:GrpB family protein [Paraliobacillus sp. JSM ZJ581]|uniref:GrpB family protein n=1 Tax=Paraliobacillus sp. JSM ZJ581 TaxID=3342118 RepID=UPI0035A8D93E
MINPVVNLSEYDPNWPLQFENEKNRINEAIGNEIIGIEHIGSTSIKGLGSKPIIDIMVGVNNLNDVEALVNALNKIDFEFVPKPEITDRKFFRSRISGRSTYHLHICEFNNVEWNEKLLFRDYLRSHPEASKEYYSLKKELATKYHFDRSTYTKAKRPFIKNIIEKASKEKA